MSFAIIATLGIPLALLKEIDEQVGAVATKSYTVPANEKWLLLMGRIERDTSATIEVRHYNDGDHTIGLLSTLSAGTTYCPVPNNANYKSLYFASVIMKEGDYIKIDWGAAQTNPRVVLRFLRCAV